MVDHNYLSAGNSCSAHSRDLFAKFGVTNPISPFEADSDMAESAHILPKMSLVVSSDSESSDSIGENTDRLGLHLGSDMKEIFIAAQQLSQQGRMDAITKREKCNTLMEFIHAQGFSTQQVNDFAKRGTLSSRVVNDLDVFVKSPLSVFGLMAAPV